MRLSSPHYASHLESVSLTSYVYGIKETTTMTKMQGVRMITFDTATAASFPLHWEFLHHLLLLLLFLLRLSTRSCIVYFTSSASWGISVSIDMTDSSGRQNRNHLNFLQSRMRDSQLKRGVLIKTVIKSLTCHSSFIYSFILYFILLYFTFFIYLLFLRSIEFYRS